MNDTYSGLFGSPSRHFPPRRQAPKYPNMQLGRLHSATGNSGNCDFVQALDTWLPHPHGSQRDSDLK